MSETPMPYKANILELVPVHEEGRVKFVIESDTTGLDLLTTLEFVEPDPDIRRLYVESLLNHSLGKERLKYMTIANPDPKSRKNQWRLPKQIIIDKEKTIQEVLDRLQQAYGDETFSEDILERFLELFVDRGFFRGLTVKINQNTEFLAPLSKEDYDIEMYNLIRDVKKDDDIAPTS